MGWDGMLRLNDIQQPLSSISLLQRIARRVPFGHKAAMVKRKRASAPIGALLSSFRGTITGKMGGKEQCKFYSALIYTRNP